VHTAAHNPPRTYKREVQRSDLHRSKRTQLPKQFFITGITSDITKRYSELRCVCCRIRLYDAQGGAQSAPRSGPACRSAHGGPGPPGRARAGQPCRAHRPSPHPLTSHPDAARTLTIGAAMQTTTIRLNLVCGRHHARHRSDRAGRYRWQYRSHNDQSFTRSPESFGIRYFMAWTNAVANPTNVPHNVATRTITGGESAGSANIVNLIPADTIGPPQPGSPLRTELHQPRGGSTHPVEPDMRVTPIDG
jgi:hypothetical protein